MKDLSDDFRKSLNIYQDIKTLHWIATFIVTTQDNKKVPKKVTSKTKEELIKEVNKIISNL